MAKILALLQGKKTHLLVIALLLLQLVGGVSAPEGGLDFSQLTDADLQKMVATGLISTLKAAWDRRSP